MRDAIVRRLIDLVVEEAEVTGSVFAEMRFACAGDADDEPDFQGVALPCSSVEPAA